VCQFRRQFNGGRIFQNERAQRRVAVALTNGWKSRHGKSRSHVAWMAGGDAGEKGQRLFLVDKPR